MPQSKILIDTDAYLRIAKEIHPLLFTLFGNDEHCLYCIQEFQNEYDRSNNLTGKFDWVNEKKYRDNRTKFVTLSKKQKRDLEIIYDHMWKHVLQEMPEGPSEVDVKILSYASLLDIPVVTDDRNARKLANIFEIETMSSLGLLKLMLDSNRVTMSEVKSLVVHWRYFNDLPHGKYEIEFKEIFGVNAP